MLACTTDAAIEHESAGVQACKAGRGSFDTENQKFIGPAGIASLSLVFVLDRGIV
jgi:hypothetical protein